MENLVDAFLYLGPQDLLLREQIPGDIVLDGDYLKELDRRAILQGFPGAGMTLTNSSQRIVDSAEFPLFTWPKQPEMRAALEAPLVKNCLERKNHDNAPQ